MTRKSAFLLIFAIFFGAGIVHSQNRTFWDETDMTPFRASGSIGFTASTYAANGIENRRAPGLFQTTANVGVTSFGFRSGLTLNYSTDDSGLRQNMNTLSYRANWRWVHVQGGDVNTRFSEYGLNGTTIRGGYIKLEPGLFLLEVTGGRSKRAVRPRLETGFREPAFEQWAFGGKIGVGRTSGNYFHLSTFYARDNIGSLGQAFQSSRSTQSSQDSQVGQTIPAIRPQENLTITPDFRVSFMDNRLSFQSEMTISAFTRDITSPALSAADLSVPDFVTGIYQPTTSTRLNFAGKSMAGYRSDLFDLNLGYERVQPGFMSLGRGSIRSDQERINMSPTFRLWDQRLTVRSNLSLSRDNLLGNRLQTQTGTNAATSVQMLVTETLNITVSYDLLLNTIKMEAAEGMEAPPGGQQQVSHNIMLQPNFTIIGGDIIQNITVSGGFMSMGTRFRDDVPGIDRSFLSESYIGMLGYTITLPTGITLSSSGNYLLNRSDGGHITNTGVNAGTSYGFFNRRLTFAFNGGFNHNQFERELPTGTTIRNRTRQMSGSLNFSWRLMDKNSFNLMVRSRNNRMIEGGDNNFTELEAALRYQRTF